MQHAITQPPPVDELERARKVFSDAVNQMPLTAGQKVALIAAGGSLEKAAASAGVR